LDGEVVPGLPTTLEFELPADITSLNVDDELADCISDKTGWCVFSFDVAVKPVQALKPTK